MRIINISFALLLVCSFKPLYGMAVVKGEGSPESSQDGNSGQTTETPDGTDVLSTKPETDSLNDADLPQLSGDLKESELLSSNTLLRKRCARLGTLRSRSGGPRLSLARRDLTNTRKQLCETCQKGILCRNQNPCTRCNRWCDNITTPPTVDQEDNAQTTNPEEKREIAETPQNTEKDSNTLSPDIIVGSRFKGIEEDKKVARYYSLASVESGPIMLLFQRLFGIPSGFEKFIILGKLGGKQPQDFNNIIVTDMARAFGNDNKTHLSIHKFENSDGANVNLIHALNEKLDELIKRKMQETGHDQLTLYEANRLINNAMGEVSNSVGSPQEDTTAAPEAETRCNLDKDVEDIMDMLPTAYGGQSKGTPHHGEKPHVQPQSYEPHVQPQSYEPHVQPQVYELEDSGEVKNPPVIQDNVNYVGKTLQDGKTTGKNLEDDYVDDTEEARPTVITENKDDPPIQEATRLINIPKETESSTPKTIVGEAPVDVLSLSDAKSVPSSDNQVNEPTLQEGNNFDNVGESAPTSSSQDLEKNVFKIVQDSLKAVTDAQNMVQSPMEEPNVGPVLEEEPREMFVEKKPSEANSESVIKTYTKPPPRGEILQTQANFEPEKTLTNLDGNMIEEPQRPEQTTKKPKPLTNVDYQDPTQLSIDQLDPIPDVPNVAEQAPNFENRGQFANDESKEKHDYFGSLVPATGVSTDVTDPRMKKVFYVGENINLPLKMFQDENGVMKLRVDTDALCNCKNKNCTKKHIDERFRTAVRENEDDQSLNLPELKVRFGRDSHKNEDLMDSFVESLHDHSETSEVFKRSAKIESEAVRDVGEEDKDLQNEKVDMENEIKKLSEDIEKYTQANKELLNKGTLSLFRDVEKTKNVDRMITLASNLLAWMKDFAMKHLDS